MLRVLGQLASSVALLFGAAALIGTTYTGGYLSGFGVALSTIRLDAGTAVLTALVPSLYLAPAALVAFGYVFAVAVGLAAPDEPRVAPGRSGMRGLLSRWFDDTLLEGVGYALVAAVISVVVLAGTLYLLNLPRSPVVILVNVMMPAAIAVIGIFPAHWIVNSPRFQASTRVWWATLGIILWSIVAVVSTYLLGTEVARTYTDELASQAPLPTSVTIRDAIGDLPAVGPPSQLGATTYGSVVLLFRDEQAWLLAVREPSTPRGFRTILVPAVQVIGVNSAE